MLQSPKTPIAKIGKSHEIHPQNTPNSLSGRILPLSLIASSTHASLVSRLVSRGFLKTPRIINAVRRFDRRRFIGSPYIDSMYRKGKSDPSKKNDFLLKILHDALPSPYFDRPFDLGYQSYMSPPHMHAICLELLASHLVPGNRVLDIGSGSGLLTAIMASLVEKGRRVANYKNSLVNSSVVAVDRVDGIINPSNDITLGENYTNCLVDPSVVAVDRVDEIINRSDIIFEKLQADHLVSKGSVLFLNLDARLPALAKSEIDKILLEQTYRNIKSYGPFDVIHIGAAVPIDPITKSVPLILLKLMSLDSKMVLPLGTFEQKLVLVTRKGSKITILPLHTVRICPLSSLAYFDDCEDSE